MLSLFSIVINPSGLAFTSGRSKKYSVTAACLPPYRRIATTAIARASRKLFLLQGHQLPLLSLLESLHETFMKIGEHKHDKFDSC